MNLLDIDVAGIYKPRSKSVNERGMRLPLTFAQSLYDTDKADRVVVLLDHWEKTEPIRKRLLTLLADTGLDCEIKRWDELSRSYSGVKRMFDAIFGFVFIIVFIVVVMSVVNTMGMTVLERTREIGTLRALGLKQRGVAVLFAIEGAMIGFLGSAVGLALNIIVWALIGIIKPTVTYPGSSSPSPFSVSLLPDLILQLTIFFTFISLVAAFLPARRASKQNIVDALGHV
jgi:putative ABC transport system permease protein